MNHENPSILTKEPQYEFYQIRKVRGKEYIFRTLVPDDVSVFSEEIAENYITFHPLFSFIENLTVERAKAFLEKVFRHTASVGFSICAVDPATNQVVSTMLASDEAILPDYNRSEWPEFYEYWYKDTLIRKLFPKIFNPAKKGLSSMLWGAWTHKDYRGAGIYRTVEECYYEFPRYLKFKYVGGITVHAGARKVSASQKGAKILYEIHYRDLKDPEGNYLYRDKMDRFIQKNFTVEDLKLTFIISTFQWKNPKPKL